MRGVWVGGLCLGLCGWCLLLTAGAAEQPAAWTEADVVAALKQPRGPQLGSPNAPLTLVEFSDFQCGYCRRFDAETLPKVNEQYIQPGKVRLIYRHLAFLGPASHTAAQAASCAHDQAKFWEYHDRLFKRTSPVAFTVARLKVYAEELGLDARAFADCLDGRSYARQIETDTLLVRSLGITGTPAFLLNNHLLVGAYPFEMFRRALDEILASPPAAR